ncbi:hypothetical protein ACP3S7_27220 [Phytobacter ursingii]
MKTLLIILSLFFLCAASTYDDLLSTGKKYQTQEEKNNIEKHTLGKCAAWMSKTPASVEKVKSKKSCPNPTVAYEIATGVGDERQGLETSPELLIQTHGSLAAAIEMSKVQIAEYDRYAALPESEVPAWARALARHGADEFRQKIMPALMCRAGVETSDPGDALPAECTPELMKQLASNKDSGKQKKSVQTDKPTDEGLDYTGKSCSWFIVKDAESCQSRVCFYSEGQSVSYGKRAYRCQSGRWTMIRDCTQSTSKSREGECVKDIRRDFGIPQNKETPAQKVLLDD